MGWEALEQWGDDVTRIEPLTGGVANDVWSVRVNGHLAVGRLALEQIGATVTLPSPVPKVAEERPPRT